jgi:hypothetical protein
MRSSPEDYILKFIVPLKEMFEENTRFLQERTGRQGLFDRIMQILRRAALINFLLFYSETEIDYINVLYYGIRYTRKLAATTAATIKIVITIPFLVVFFFALGMSLFSDKH